MLPLETRRRLRLLFAAPAAVPPAQHAHVSDVRGAHPLLNYVGAISVMHDVNCLLQIKRTDERPTRAAAGIDVVGLRLHTALHRRRGNCSLLLLSLPLLLRIYRAHILGFHVCAQLLLLLLLRQAER